MNYDHHFLIKLLLETFEREFNCQGENTVKNKTFVVQITKEVKKMVKMERKLQIPYPEKL